jgi:hypothetical protein
MISIWWDDSRKHNSDSNDPSFPSIQESQSCFFSLFNSIPSFNTSSFEKHDKKCVCDRQEDFSLCWQVIKLDTAVQTHCGDVNISKSLKYRM